MVRKIIACTCLLALILATGLTAQASTHQVYEEGNISTTYITYFADILSGAKFNDNYVAFRSGQNEYVMIVGDLVYSNGEFALAGEKATEYKFYQSGNYSSQFYYTVTELTSVDISFNNRIIYSDLGQYPQLVSRGEKYEMLTTLLLIITLLAVVIRSFFVSR